VDRVDANSHAPAAPESAAAAADIAATGSPAGVDALTLPGTEVDPTAWQDTACALATDLLPALLKPEQCGDVYVGVLTSVVLGVPTAVLGLMLWLLRRRAARRSVLAEQKAIDPAPALDPATLTRLQRLFLGLPRWHDARRRRDFVTLALGKGHPLLDDIDCAGTARDAAMSVIDACTDAQACAVGGHAPLCALLAAIPREFGPHPARDPELAALRATLGCD
jgi:hypothetical protein